MRVVTLESHSSRVPKLRQQRYSTNAGEPRLGYPSGKTTLMFGVRQHAMNQTFQSLTKPITNTRTYAYAVSTKTRDRILTNIRARKYLSHKQNPFKHKQPVTPPAPRLVDVELNPGPPKHSKQHNKKNHKPRVKTVVRTVVKHQKPQEMSFGAKLGDAAWNVGSKLFKSITGLGSYHISGTPLSMGNGPPMFNGGRAPRVSHREYLGDILSTTDFTVREYRINPASIRTFPWLASMADRFEQYRLHGCVFEFKSTSADALNSTNTALGTVIGAAVYDSQRGANYGNIADLPTFKSKLEMENYQFAVSTAPSRSAMFPIELARNQTPINELYLVSDETYEDASSVGDRRLNDIGTFVLATSGMQAIGSNIGELWVTYDVELLKPRIDPNSSKEVPTVHLVSTCTTPNEPFGAVDLYSSNNIRFGYANNALVLGDTPGSWCLTIMTKGAHPGVGAMPQLAVAFAPLHGEVVNLSRFTNTSDSTTVPFSHVHTDNTYDYNVYQALFKWSVTRAEALLNISVALEGADDFNTTTLDVILSRISDDFETPNTLTAKEVEAQRVNRLESDLHTVKEALRVLSRRTVDTAANTPTAYEMVRAPHTAPRYFK
jgi:hypothetical protein